MHKLVEIVKIIIIIHEHVCVDCSHILDTPVTEREFLEQLHELNHKINFVKEQSFKDARSCHDVKDILEKLKIKASFQSYYFNLVYKWLLSHIFISVSNVTLTHMKT